MIDAGEEPENKEEVHVDTCIRSTSTGKRMRFLLSLRRRQWNCFDQNGCFYNKASPKYSNASYKGKILQEFAQELGTECEF